MEAKKNRLIMNNVNIYDFINYNYRRNIILALVVNK